MPVKTPEISRLLMRFFLSLILFSAWAWARACVGLIGRRRLADNGPHVMGRTKRPEQAPQNAQKDRETNTPLHPIKIPIPPFNTSHHLTKNVDLESISSFQAIRELMLAILIKPVKRVFENHLLVANELICKILGRLLWTENVERQTIFAFSKTVILLYKL